MTICRSDAEEPEFTVYAAVTERPSLSAAFFLYEVIHCVIHKITDIDFSYEFVENKRLSV
jgi:hypothetical protein